MYSYANSTTNTSKKPFEDLPKQPRPEVRYPDSEMWEKKRLGLDHDYLPYFIRWDVKKHGKGKNRIDFPGYEFDYPPPASSRTSLGCGYYLVDKKLAHEAAYGKGEFEIPDSSSDHSDLELEDEDYEDEDYEDEDYEEEDDEEEDEDEDEDYEEEDEDYEDEDYEQDQRSQRQNNELLAATAERDALLALKNQKEVRTQVDQEVESMRELIKKKKQKIDRRQKRLENKEKELMKLEKKQELEHAREELCRLKALKASTAGSVYPQAPKKTSQPPKIRMKKRKLMFEEDTSTHNYNLRSRSRI